ncbi:allophanate hydrolase 2 subunit 2 [Vibrio sp. JCM 19236]|nr:allophanate hydrolase 2 subunit 2 [Vibrio sp. JCM 19236]
MLSLLQDVGRNGYQHIGITQGGPMDEHAYHWCNRLLGNDHRDTVLEITFGLLQLEALKPTTIALTGADLGARLNDRKIGPWSTYSIKPGDQLSFEQPISGLRAYLGVKGGFLCSKTLESSSTVSRESIGGLDGKGSPLKAGDEIPFIASSPLAKKQTPEWAIEEYDAPLELGVIQGYQFEHFCKEQVSNFTPRLTPSATILIEWVTVSLALQLSLHEPV